MTLLTFSQVEAIKALSAKRDEAINGIAEVLKEAGLDPDIPYDVNFTTREATSMLPPMPKPNRAARRQKKA